MNEFPKALSPKQRRVMNWWRKSSPDRDKDVIICDGAVRSGKTLCLTLSFFLWASACCRGEQLALCGKTIEGVRRSLLFQAAPALKQLGLRWHEQVSKNRLTAGFPGRENTFYLFGGKDEGSAALIQGMTLAGVLLDEAAVMPESFVEQACARCSVPGSRIWMSCNPEGPGHWFYQNWILRAGERNALRLRFTMDDNPGLAPEIRARYRALFQGVFYRRFVLGEWVAAQGLVYDFFREEMTRDPPESGWLEWYISCDYGTVNPTSMGLWGRTEEGWFRVKEFYYDSRREKRQKTDEEYADALEALAAGREIRAVIADPSAASFMEVLRRRGWRVRKAENDVLSGIRTTARLLRTGRIVICRTCTDAIREFGLYRWEDRDRGTDRVRKENDHAMDDIRYFAATVANRGPGGFFAGSVERERI
ncbi:MAG: PBSX family phage terminase large subunit [Lawsonibacter sp.]|nr:PBSX family phage terminase large subunit [Lawsonibacter sp.]